MKTALLPAFCLALLTCSCDGEKERYEDVVKLRALGVLSDKAVVEPSTAATSQSISLTFYAAHPHGEVITAEAYQDSSRSSAGVPATLIIDPNSAATEAHASLDIYHVKATLSIPPAEALKFQGINKNATVPYAVKLTSRANGTQIIVGNIVVFAAGSPQLATLAFMPTVKITAPTKAAAVSGNQDLSASATTTGDESLRLGWFTSDGEIKNRNAAVTTWDPKKTTGEVTLIATVRGAKTGAFALDVVDFTAN